MTIDWKKELVDQPLHVLGGFATSFFVSWVTMTIGVPWYVSVALGLVIARLLWMAREWWQHREHNHEPRYWWSLDLLFIDIGIIGGLVAAYFTA